MQTTLLGLAIAFILALVAALVGPLFIDWNQFRPQFEAEASRVVGAPVRVEGTLDARLLPTPSLRLQSITVGSPNDLGRFRADKLAVDFSLSSLMRGEWRATELSIGGASVDLGLNAQGRIDLPAATGPFNLGALAIDRLNVTGRIALHDAASRSTLELNDIAFSGDVRSLAAGAMRGDGNFMLSGARYPFRISSGQTADGNGTRVHLNVDPGEKPVSIDLDGILNFDNRAPRFDGALTLASPIGLKIKNAGDRIPTPWRLSAKLKADSSKAHFEAIETSYGTEETALRFTGAADMRFGEAPLLRAALSAKQLDADRLLAKDNPNAGDAVMPLSALRKLIAAVPHPPLATQLELNAEQIMIGGRPVQAIAADLRNDTRSWTVDRLELRAPGATQLMLSGGIAQPGVTDGFKAALNIESTDPDLLVAWLQGRTDVSLRSQKPLRIRGDFTSTPDQMRIDALKAEIDGGTVEGRITYANASSAGGSRIDAQLKADRLDLDAAAALIRSIGGPQAQWPDAGQLSLDVDRAISAGRDLTPFSTRVAYSPKAITVDRFKVGDAASLMFDGSAAFDRVDATGKLALDATSASFGQITGMLAPFAPSLVARLDALPAAQGPARVKLALDLARDPQHGDRALARAVLDVDAPQITGVTTITASPTVVALRSGDLAALSRSSLTFASKLSGQGSRMLALLGLNDVVSAGDAAVNFEASATGAWQAPLRVKATFAGDDLDAEIHGDIEPWTAQPKATLTLAVRRANLAPLLDLKPTDTLAQSVSLNTRLSLNSDRLVLEDLDSTLAGSRLRGRIALTLGASKAIDGRIGLDTLDLAPALGLALGTRGRDDGAPLGRGVLHGWSGQLAMEALRGVLPGGGEVRPISAVLKSDGRALTIDAIKGKIGDGELAADIDLKPTPSGFALGARAQLDHVEGTALRYRALRFPAGKTSLRLTLASQGRSASALEGAVSGSGLVTIEPARIVGLDAGSFDAAIRASDAGQIKDDAQLRQLVTASLSAGALSLASVQVPFEIKDSRLRVGATTLDGEGARAVVSGGYDIVADQADLRVSLTATASGQSSVRPEIQLFATGTPDRLNSNVDVAALSSWLAVRAIDRETRRLDAMEKDRATAVPAKLPPAVTAPVEPASPQAPAAAPSLPAPSGPNAALPDSAMPVRDPRRTLPKASTPRPAVTTPGFGQQVAPLPAPIEVRPAPGTARHQPRPRASAPLVLTPPDATSPRPN